MGEPSARHTIPHDGPDLTKPGNHRGDLLAPLLPAGEPVEQLLRKAQFFVPGGTPSPDFREVHRKGGRGAEEFYRERWRHDKVVRSTHGVNCTGSCSWKVYVKDGIITWETQQTDYPSTGPDSPEYEPRGCPRGASFSWYTYSPSRVRYLYVRSPLLELWREARARLGDPAEAWAEITGDPDKAARYKRARGQGGFVRAAWPEVTELIAAAHVHTVKAYGPDRVVGFSPIPAMSQVSYSAGTRFLSLIGGTVLSFYDWYADLPPASPQVFGDQTDVPESGDWWNAAYLIIWGTNLPITRTPDAHFMTEARYRGQKVVVVSPDYSDHTKFADDWLAAAPGTDGALAMAMGHVILAEFFRDRQVPYFTDYVKTYTDAPFLVTLELPDPAGHQAHPHDRRLRPAVLGLQLLRSHRQPARRDRRDPQALPGGGVLMRVMAQMAMVMNLDKCIGCHTCTVTCEQTWTNRPGLEYVYFNNVETKPGLGYPKRYEDQDQWKGGWTLDRKGRLQLKGGSRLRRLLSIFYNPDLPTIDEYGDPWTYDYQKVINAPPPHCSTASTYLRPRPHVGRAGARPRSAGSSAGCGPLRRRRSPGTTWLPLICRGAARGRPPADSRTGARST